MILGKTLLALSLLTCMFLLGCANDSPSDANKLPSNANDLPSDKFLVGGGQFFDYSAPEHGSLIYADKTTGKILWTRGLKKEESFGVSGLTEEMHRLLETEGIDLSKARFVLYFVPTGKWSK